MSRSTVTTNYSRLEKRMANSEWNWSQFRFHNYQNNKLKFSQLTQTRKMKRNECIWCIFAVLVVARCYALKSSHIFRPPPSLNEAYREKVDFKTHPGAKSRLCMCAPELTRKCLWQDIRMNDKISRRVAAGVDWFVFPKLVEMDIFECKTWYDTDKKGKRQLNGSLSFSENHMSEGNTDFLCITLFKHI